MLPAIEHLKSGLSINTNNGCQLGCKYCIVKSINNNSRTIDTLCTPADLIDRLENNKYFVINKTPLFVNNRTDPFIVGVEESTIKVLSLLAERKYGNCIVVISKLPPSESIKHFFSRLNLMYIYTNTNMPRGIDYNSNNGKLNEDIKIIQNNSPFDARVHSFRPIIPNLNDNISNIYSFIHETRNVFSKHIIAGVRIVDNNIDMIKRISGFKFEDYDNRKKYLSNRFEGELKKMLSKEKTIIRHTSCAIASFMKEPIKLYNYFGQDAHCNPNCSNYNICKKGTEVSDLNKRIIDETISRMTTSNYKWEDGKIVFLGTVEEETVAAIKNAFGINVYAKSVISSFSERVLRNEG